MASLIPILAQLAVASLVIRVAYLCYFHPLARYPGPFWARFTNLWRFFTFLGGHHHLSEQQLHEKYGRVVRVAPDWLSFSSLEDFDAIYGFNKSIEKGDFFTFGRGSSQCEASIFSTKSNSLHRQKKRKVFGPALSSAKVGKYESVITKHVAVLLARLESSRRPANDRIAAVNVAPLMSQFTLDTMLEVLFGPAVASHPYTDSAVAGDICSQLRKMTKMAWSFSLWPFYGWVMNSRPVSAFLRRPFYQKKGVPTGMAGLMAAGHISITRNPESIARAPQPGIVKSWLEVPVDDANRMTQGEVLAEAMNMVFAGPGSMAAALTAILRKEAVFFGGNTMAASIPLELQAVIKETMRLRAVFPTAFPRVIKPGAERVIPSLSSPLPVGTTVSANTYVLGRSRELWGDDVDEWTPQRWLGDDEHRRQMETKFIAFSRGPRGCIGRDLAMLVIAKAVMALLQQWQIRSVGQLEGRSWLEMQYDDCWLELERRIPAW
ncbi:cytochrome P450 pisatin demethylase [Aspergillus sclerotioniger CBS 115572]|uniref:Cytochrome P450 pisatin demethylase n=1 Tax=Aspergillus sclerotioniger CBS 115572 TaxID=1450535 RepID=A0A317X880_9EURO|nr:cytochrome P450 pisatin demethylase [Aspergillus sclerotioniger CBS 115572]PWY94814.1 cytochrome P450 pisatin demethylase [Aspergillus sclerotioniger CBS 115572]